MLHLGLVDDARDAELERELVAEIATAIDEVEKLPQPERESLVEDVYAEAPWNLREQRDELRRAAPAPTHG